MSDILPVVSPFTAVPPLLHSVHFRAGAVLAEVPLCARCWRSQAAAAMKRIALVHTLLPHLLLPFLSPASSPAGAVPLHAVLPDDQACSGPVGCEPLSLLEKGNPADPVVVVCSERYRAIAARGLDCTLPSKESWEKRRRNEEQPQSAQDGEDEPSSVEPTHALLSCGNGSEIHIVSDEQNFTKWKRTLQDLLENGPKGATLIGIGRMALKSFHFFQHGNSQLSSFFSRVALITLYPLGEDSFLWKSDATCPTTVECFFFDIFPGVFAAGVSAGLPAWTRQAVAIITDRRSADGSPFPFDTDLTFKAFVSGVKYANPALDVITTQVSFDMYFPHDSFTVAVGAEIRTLMQQASVIYLDIFSESSLIAALQEMHETTRGLKAGWAILPPWFRPYTDDGAPQERWNRVVFNSVSVDWARAVRDIIANPGHHEKLTIQDGYVTTLWTKSELDSDSLWMNDFTGVFDKQPNQLKDLSRFPCGQRDRSIYEHMNVAWHGLTAPEKSTERATCNVMAKGCNIKEKRDLKLKQGKIPQTWPDMFCRPLPGFPKRCQGSPIEQDSCSAPDGDDSSPAMLRRVGVGLSGGGMCRRPLNM
ncbi:unnamed protein product [Prorocentrum cordatum]|uniref:Uncharacterized protein n=1 Tax=Prorocentrum cordatum TaxID=2364126 RepID=A0ABN9UAZ6_9DINO|nr:unnamed protein product [Polarella glacialis]